MKLILIVFITYCVHSLHAQSFSSIGCVDFTQTGNFAFEDVLSPTDCSSKCAAQDPLYKYFILYQFDGATCECFYRLAPNSVAANSSFCDFKCDKNCATNCEFCGSSDGNYANKYSIIRTINPTTNTPITPTTTTTAQSLKTYSSMGCVYYDQFGDFAFEDVFSPRDCLNKCAAQDPNFKYFLLDQYDGSNCGCFYRYKPNSMSFPRINCDLKCDKNCVTNCEFCGSSDGNYGNKYAINLKNFIELD